MQSPRHTSLSIRQILRHSAVVPVLTIIDLEHAVPLAEALCAGGLRVLEITMRTPVALKAVEAILSAVPAATVGVGTLIRPSDVPLAVEAGAKFGVSPGLTAELASAARDLHLPLLPGVMTPTDLIGARNLGFDTVKLFPAEQSGGLAMLKTLASVFPDVAFCPTGGLTPQTALGYLSHASVICVGGSWLAPQQCLETRDWNAIERLASQAAHLRQKGVSGTHHFRDL